MNRLLINLLIAMFINCYYSYSQTNIYVDKWMEYIEELATEIEDQEQIESLYTELSYLSEHPFDINKVTAEQLDIFPFLSDIQIQEIIDYRHKYGNMVSLYELKNIEELDFQTISLLLPFIYIDSSGDPVDKLLFTVDNLLKKGRNELKIRYDQCFQQKKGYKEQADTILAVYPNRKYLGEPFYHSFSYSYTFDDRLQIGLVGEKDAGEPFWNKYHKGYDYYSVHLFLKDISKLKSLVIGDYKVSFGQGLVVSNDFKPSRSTALTQRRNYGFRRHYSTNETDFFRGAAATLSFDKLEYSFFYSYRKMDASVESGKFTSIKIDGLHRLPRDRENKQAVSMQTLGGNIRYSSTSFSMGVTALSYSFGKLEMQPDPKPYNLYYFRGSRNINASIDYLLKSRYVKFSGETAFSQNGALATLNNIQLTPTSYVMFLLSHRYYDKQYQSFFGNAFSQNTAVQNEQGIYMGIQFTPFPYWKLSAYADTFRFPWLKYGVDAPSKGKEYMGQVDYTKSKSFSAYLRYRYRENEKNYLQEGNNVVSILPCSQHRLRLQTVYALTSSVVFRTSVDGIFYQEQQTKNKGFMFAQSMGWKPVSIPVQTDLYIGLFRTDNYTTRISSYEKNLLYAFNMPSFYGKGIRLATTISWKILDRLSLSAKFACTHYTDRDTIGTDLELIEGSTKTDLYAILNWKF